MSKRKDKALRIIQMVSRAGKQGTGFNGAVLYHYTSFYYLPKILASGYLKLTESNLIAPDGTWETELKSKKYKGMRPEN